MIWAYLLTALIVCTSPGIGVGYGSTLGRRFTAGFRAAAEVGLGRLIELGFGFTLVTLLTFLGYAAPAATGQQRRMASDTATRWLRRAFAASFAALGLKLAVESA